MLLRYFVNLYDMEIIEEEAFLSWKEDISQEFPGKGKALFQVFNSFKLYSILKHNIFSPSLRVQACIFTDLFLFR